jgi:hypothetical protein
MMIQQNTEQETLFDRIGPFVAIPHSFVKGARGLSFHARWLFVALRYYTNGKSGLAFPSYDKIRQLTGMRRAMIAKSIGELEHAGWLRRQRRFNTSTLYEIVMPRPPSQD